MNFGEVVVAIVAISALASVLRALFSGGAGRRHERIMRTVMQTSQQNDPETRALREEVRGLKERIVVLERVITDQSSTSALDREFEKLKQMD